MSKVIDVDSAVRLLAAGGVVAVPTDTVYGIAASLSHPSAIATLFGLKRRPESVALPVLVDSLAQIEQLGVNWTENARRLGEAFWPGALTIVVRVPDELARRVGSSTNTVGFRMPNDGLLRDVLARSGPLAVSSANEHGEPPCHIVAEVLNAFGGQEDLEGVVDGGERSGRVSCVVELSDTSWRLVRVGAISTSELETVLD